ncbi:MAG TPA: hypothetical protein VMZ91_03535 [Candidatus Paceibacterota bacterium]|nr:hypothetical protein [Candidatus Paceibacterota bacterium]
MRRFDKNKVIAEANLRLEREFIISKSILLNTTTSNTFIESCLNSQYFNEDEKSFIIETVIPNQKLIQEGGWDWIKKNVIDPTKDAVKKGIDKAKSFYNKIKELISNIGGFLKKIWSHIIKFGEWLWDKVLDMVKNKINKNKAKIEKDLEKFKNLPPQKRDTEIEQFIETGKFWKTKSKSVGITILDTFSKDVGDSINKIDYGSESVMEHWAPEVIDFFSKSKKILKEGGGKSQKVVEWIVNVISWVIKIPVRFFEKVFSKLSQGILVLGSLITNKLGGPGPFEFPNLSHLIGSTLFTICEAVVVGSHVFHSKFPHNFITNIIEGWEHVMEEVLKKVVGSFAKPLVVTLSIIGVILGVMDMIFAFQHLKKEKDLSQYDEKDLNKDGKVDGYDEKLVTSRVSSAYYNVTPR